MFRKLSSVPYTLQVFLRCHRHPHTMFEITEDEASELKTPLTMIALISPLSQEERGQTPIERRTRPDLITAAPCTRVQVWTTLV